MSKLFKFKEWLTIPEAARYLSISFGEQLTEADVLRLGLDGHMKISVNFINHAVAKLGKIVPWEQTQWTMFPNLDLISNTVKPRKSYPAENEALPDGAIVLDSPPALIEAANQIPESERSKYHPLMRSLKIDHDHYINLEEESVTTVRGIWDVPLFGGAHLDLQFAYQNHIDGPEVTLVNIDGAFVLGHDDVICQIQESFDDNKYQKGSNAQLEEIKQHIAINDISDSDAKALIDKHKVDRKEWLEYKKTQPRNNGYYPAGGLPKDCLLVVRTSEIRRFEQSLNEEATTEEKPLSTRERNNMLKIIKSLCDTQNLDLSKPYKAAEIIKQQIELNGGNLSIETIATKLEEAKKS